MPPLSRKKRGALTLVQVKITRGAAALLRKRAKHALRSQASYLRNVIYRDLGLFPASWMEADLRQPPASLDGSRGEK